VLSADLSSPIQVFVIAPGKTYTINVDRHQRGIFLYMRLKILSGMQQYSCGGCTFVCAA
jgi:hypothetical protein